MRYRIIEKETRLVQYDQERVKDNRHTYYIIEKYLFFGIWRTLKDHDFQDIEFNSPEDAETYLKALSEKIEKPKIIKEIEL